MSLLPPAAPRKPLHTRTLRFDGYHREDGLWDIEARLTDTKAYMWNSLEHGDMPPGTPLHDMLLRVTLDDDLKIVAIDTAMPGAPHAVCQLTQLPMQKMVGETIGPGWRMKIDKALGGVQGCTHFRELLFNLATAALQAIPPYRARVRRATGVVETGDQPPFFLGQCMTWDFDGPTVREHFPQFAGWKPVRRTKPEQ